MVSAQPSFTSDASGPHQRTNVLGEGLSTAMHVAGRAGHARMQNSLVTGSDPSGFQDDGLVRQVVLAPKAIRGAGSPSKSRPDVDPFKEHQENLKRAQMRSLRSAVARDKHAGPGRAPRPKPPPVLNMVGEAPSSHHTLNLPPTQAASLTRPLEPRSPRSNNGLLSGTVPTMGNGFFGATLEGKRVRGVAVQTSKPHSAAAPTKPAAKSLQFAPGTLGGSSALPSETQQMQPQASLPLPPQPSLDRRTSVSSIATSLTSTHRAAKLPSHSGSSSTLFTVPSGGITLPVVDLDVSEVWLRNSTISKSLYKRAGTYSADDEAKMSFATSYNDALRQLKDKLQFKGRDNFLVYFDRYRPSMDAPQEVDGKSLRAALKDMNLTFSDDILATLASNLGVQPGQKVNYRNLTDALQRDTLNFVSMKVTSGRFRALAAPDPAQPLGDSSVKGAPFAVATIHEGQGVGQAVAHVGRMAERIKDLESALKKYDLDQDGCLNFKEFYAALSEVSRQHRLHLGDSEISAVFQDYDTKLKGMVEFKPLLAKAVTGAYPEYLRPRKERASGHFARQRKLTGVTTKSHKVTGAKTQVLERERDAAR